MALLEPYGASEDTDPGIGIRELDPGIFDLSPRMLSQDIRHTEIGLLELHGTPDRLSWVHMGPGDGSSRAK